MARTKKSSDDTIAAIATPTGAGGVAVIRISGPNALAVLERIFLPQKEDSRPLPYLLRFGRIIGQNGSDTLDEVLAAYVPSPKSFTGEEMVEIHCHAGHYTAKNILDNILIHDCRPAEAGEFSLRRFLNHGVDLTKLEGAAEVVAAKTDLAFRLSKEHLLGAYGEHLASLREKIVGLLAEVEADIDFPDEEAVGTLGRQKLTAELEGIITALGHLAEGYRTGKIIQDGYRVAIMGPPNAGKSSLFNRLVKRNRALVTAIPGTTRDYLAEWIDLDGLPVELFDTAGMRVGRGVIEKAGIEKSRRMAAGADLVIYVIDASARKIAIPKILGAKNQESIIAFNKCDLVDDASVALEKWRRKVSGRGDHCFISAMTGRGISHLTTLISQKAGVADLTDSLVVTSHRHKVKIDRALVHLRKLHKNPALPAELMSFELRQAAGQIDEITGHISTEEILDEIFSRFCIGK